MNQYFLVFLCLCFSPFVEATNLDLMKSFVNKADSNFHFSAPKSKVVATGGTYYFGTFTSQRWLDDKIVQPSLWHHHLYIYVPSKLIHQETALFYLGAGNRSDPLDPSAPPAYIMELGERTGAAVVVLRGLPPQPLQFYGDGEDRYEDNIVAYSWDRYLKTGDVRWLPRLPMLKASVRALDVAQEWLKSSKMGQIKRFVAMGASKRGWVSWLLPLVDTRIVGIVPMVIDILNVVPSMLHHRESYGSWSPVLKDYVRYKIMDRINSKEFVRMAEIVDPYNYREHLTIPKLVMTAANDQFFLPDSSRFYYDDLKGPKYMRVTPNSGHHLNVDVSSIGAFFNAVSRGKSLPKLVAVEEKPGSKIAMLFDRKPNKVQLWQASNPSGFDFRMTGPKYTRYLASNLSSLAGAEKSFHFDLPQPKKGCVATFALGEFKVDGLAWQQSSRVFVTCAPAFAKPIVHPVN